MSEQEAKLATAASIEMYAQTMVSKGLHARAQWAFTEARNIRMIVHVEAGEQTDKTVAVAA